jgi:hypothetical protein
MARASEGWWHSRDEERLYGPEPTREAAVQAGTTDYGGEPFFICFGRRMKHRTNIFDSERIADWFNDANEEMASEDEQPADKWEGSHEAELERELDRVFAEWIDRHGYRDAWAIDAEPSERIEPAQVGRNPEGQDPQGLGAEHEHAVPVGDAPNPLSSQGNPHDI